MTNYAMIAWLIKDIDYFTRAAFQQGYQQRISMIYNKTSIQKERKQMRDKSTLLKTSIGFGIFRIFLIVLALSAAIAGGFFYGALKGIVETTPTDYNIRPKYSATIIYDEFRKERVEIPKDIAGMLVSAIISDTLVLTSPTTTEEDIKAAEKLAKLAGIDLKKFGKELFKESTSIKGLSIDELIKGDFKTYQINGGTYGIAVITTSDFDEIKDDIPKYVSKLNEMHSTSYDGVLMFILDIFKEGSYVLYDDSMKDVIASSFNITNLVEGYFIKGLISRKKQILPALIKELEK